MDTTNIDRWLEQGLISAEAAAQMRADVKRGGAGSGLLVLAAVLNGAVLFAFTRLHGLDVGVHEILLLWLACVLPLAYGTRAKALSAACAALFVGWFVAVAFRGLDVFAAVDRLPWVAPIFVLGGVTAFALGGLHYFVPGMENVARPARIVALQAVVLGLFAMTLPRVAAGASFWNELRDLDASSQVAVAAVVAGVICVGATVTGQVFYDRARRLTRAEAPVNIALVLLTLAFAHQRLLAGRLRRLSRLLLRRRPPRHRRGRRPRPGAARHRRRPHRRGGEGAAGAAAGGGPARHVTPTDGDGRGPKGGGLKGSASRRR